MGERGSTQTQLQNPESTHRHDGLRRSTAGTGPGSIVAPPVLEAGAGRLWSAPSQRRHERPLFRLKEVFRALEPRRGCPPRPAGTPEPPKGRPAPRRAFWGDRGFPAGEAASTKGGKRLVTSRVSARYRRCRPRRPRGLYPHRPCGHGDGRYRPRGRVSTADRPRRMPDLQGNPPTRSIRSMFSYAGKPGPLTSGTGSCAAGQVVLFRRAAFLAPSRGERAAYFPGGVCGYGTDRGDRHPWRVAPESIDRIARAHRRPRVLGESGRSIPPVPTARAPLLIDRAAGAPGRAAPAFVLPVQRPAKKEAGSHPPDAPRSGGARSGKTRGREACSPAPARESAGHVGTQKPSEKRL